MPGRHEFSSTTKSVNGHALDLVREMFGPGECVVDLGFGDGTIAEACRDLGYTYIGFDRDRDSIKALRDRGFEAHEFDLLDVEAIGPAVLEALGARSLAGLTMLDTLQRLTNGQEMLLALRAALSARPSAPLILSVPNVTHLEVAAKLLQGRWDVTEAGLLDSTHVSFFSAGRLTAMTQGAGWHQVRENDFRLIASDQHFPGDDVALLTDAPLQQLLSLLRTKAEPSGTVNQFVRAFLPGPVKEARIDPDDERPFLTVLTRTQGRRSDTFQETLLCLAAQECLDFECLVLAHDVSPQGLDELKYLIDTLPTHVAGKFQLVPVIGGGRSRPLNVGIGLARGRYVAILDDDDLVFGHWVQQFRLLSEQQPGRVLRAGVVVQEVQHGQWLGRREYRNLGGFKAPYEPEFDLLHHLLDNQSPPCRLAFPLSCFRDLGISFDEDLPVLEDWDVLLQSAIFCGVAATTEVTSVYRWWPKGDSSLTLHTKLEWQSSHKAVVSRLDAVPLLLPSGSVSRIRELLKKNDRQRHELHALRDQLQQARQHARNLQTMVDGLKMDYDRLSDTAHEANEQNQKRFEEIITEFRTSLSWRLTRPVRAASVALRRRRSR
jgi:hypothetical protein